MDSSSEENIDKKLIILQRLKDLNKKENELIEKSLKDMLPDVKITETTLPFYSVLSFIYSISDFFSNLNFFKSATSSVSKYENKFSSTLSNFLTPIQDFFTYFYELFYGGNYLSFNDLYITKFYIYMKDFISSTWENTQNRINIGFGSNVKFWILGILIFYWKLTSLKGKKIRPGSQQLNMFVYPSSINEYRENKRRVENQRKVHDKNFFSYFSKRDQSYDNSYNYDNSSYYGQNTRINQISTFNQMIVTK
eukprot:gene6170-10177_t